jgi:hypothetical protein
MVNGTTRRAVEQSRRCFRACSDARRRVRRYVGPSQHPRRAGQEPELEGVVEGLREKDARGVQLIIPASAVIETGNHVTNLQDGYSRRICAERFEKVLGAVARGEVPWALHQLDWGDRFLEKLCVGVAGTGSFVDCATQGLGCGDLAILVERELFLERSAISRAEVWTLDAQLAAYAA